MAEYIERKALLASVESIDWYSVNRGKLTTGAKSSENALYKANDIYAAIDNAPSADVAPVVRCKDCKHCDPENYHCDHHMGTAAPLKRKPDDFCSYGERKEDSDKG